MAITLSNGNKITGFSSSGSSGQTSTSGTVYAAGGEDILAKLLQQLLAGGTPEQNKQRAAREREIVDTRDIRQDYSKQAAFADAAGLISQQQRLALEELVPSINRAAEGAGTSAGSMRALLLQDAATKAAEAASAAGVKTAVDYGQIAAGLSNTLEALTRPSNETTDALLKALEISKGSRSESKTKTSGSGSSTGLNAANNGQRAWADLGGFATFGKDWAATANMFKV